MEISDKQLYDYCYGFSSFVFHGLFNYSGKKYISLGIEKLELYKTSSNLEDIKEALRHFDSASTILKDENLISALYDCCLCCFYLGLKTKYDEYKMKLQNITFPKELEDCYSKAYFDPTGFRTIFKIVKSLVTKTDYISHADMLRKAKINFEDKKEKALRDIEKICERGNSGIVI